MDENILSPFDMCGREDSDSETSNIDSPVASVYQLLSLASSWALGGKRQQVKQTVWSTIESSPITEALRFYDILTEISRGREERFLLHLKDKGDAPLSLLEDISSIFRGRLRVVVVAESTGLSDPLLKDLENRVADERTGLVLARKKSGKIHTVAFQGEATFEDLAPFLAVNTYTGVPAEYLAGNAFITQLTTDSALAFLDGFPTEVQLQLQELAKEDRLCSEEFGSEEFEEEESCNYGHGEC